MKVKLLMGSTGDYSNIVATLGSVYLLQLLLLQKRVLPIKET